jgi:hypothetical protein
MRKGHVFKIFVRIGMVEDLLFYHFPREALISNGKIPWRDFTWQFGRPDGEYDEGEFTPVTIFCKPVRELRWQPCDDDDEDKARQGPRAP